MTRVGHLVVGPPGHGVVEIARATARGRVVEIPSLRELSLASLAGVDVVHTHYTDRLFGAGVDEAADAFTRLVGALSRPVTVTLHDLPLPGHEPAWRERRSSAYSRITLAAAGIVVSSEHEARAVPDGGDAARAVIPLPIDRPPPGSGRPASTTGEVGVLGWIYPGKGHADVLAALPRAVNLVALGSVSPGHDDLLGELMRVAGGRLRVSGFLDEVDLITELRRIAVPVAPNHNVSASASVGSWLGAGRRPLVADGPWARELAARCPGAITRYARGELRDAIDDALDDPGRTWLGDVPVGPSSAEVAAQLEAFILGVR